MIKEYFNHLKEKKQRAREIEDDYNIRMRLEEKRKSPERRELEKYQKEREEAKIKKMVKIERAKHDKDFWKTTILNKDNMLKGRNIFK